MRGFGLTIFLLFSVHNLVYGIDEKLLAQLDSVIEYKEAYLNQKMKKIGQFHLLLKDAEAADQFNILENIYDEYKSYNYDSAFNYAMRLQQNALQSKDPVKIATAKMKVGFVLISAGLFYEALDTLQTISVKSLPDRLQIQYYYMMVRTYYDVAEFVRNPHYGYIYALTAAKYSSTAMQVMDQKSFEYLLIKGLNALHVGEMEKAKAAYEDLVFNYNLSNQNFAIVASTLSYIYGYFGDIPKSEEMLVKAAIADIKSGTKETIALMKIAEAQFAKGDLDNAYKYIVLAMDDANFYGARHRRMQVASVLPAIETARLSKIESKRKALMLYSIVITISVVLVSGFFYVLFRQHKKLQKARKIIIKANQGMKESNKIKEEYLWYYFNLTAKYIDKLAGLKATIEQKVRTKKIEDLRFTSDSINIKREREELFDNFDEVFLKLFPNFVDVFNSLLTEGNKIELGEGQLLNTELRIFALIRLGMQDHEKIAKILGYSLTTIYTYKTKIKSKSNVSSSEFDKTIMNIPAL